MVDRSEHASSSCDIDLGPSSTMASSSSPPSSSSAASQVSVFQRPTISSSNSRPNSPLPFSSIPLIPPIYYDNSNPWMDMERGYQLGYELQQQEQDAKDLQRLNQETSWLLKCPPEVVSWILFWLADALDIRNLLGTCSLLSRHWVSWDWFELSKRRFPNWYKEASLGDLPDTELPFQRPGLVGLAGRGTIVVSNWKRIFTKDAALRRRLGHPLPSLTPSDQNNDVAIFDPLQENHPLCLCERDQKHLRVLLDKAQYFPSDVDTMSEKWHRVSSPVYNIDLDSKTTLSASMLARKGENADQFEFRVLIYALPNLTDPIAICDSKLWEVDQLVEYEVAMAHEARRQQPPPQAQGNDVTVTDEVQAHEAQAPQTPVTPQLNDVSQTTARQDQPPVSRPWHHPFTANELPVVQLVELKHYFTNSGKTTQSSHVSDKNKDKNSRGHTTSEMRVMFALAFGQNVGEDEMLLLDVWRLVKVVEITLPSVLRDQGRFVHVPAKSLEAPVPGRVETIEVSAEEDMRARMVKIYNVTVKEAAPTPPASTASPTLATPTFKEEHHGLMVSNVLSTQPTVHMQAANASFAQQAFVTKTCIAIFGIQNSDASSAMMLRKLIFTSRAESEESQCRRQISRGVSCMTLFPYQSGYDRLLVLYNRHGRGMIWDWVNENQVGQLRMLDDIISNPRPVETPNAPPAGGVAGADGNVNATANNNNNAQTAVVSTPNRRRLSYWGVQVSFTETPNPFTLNPTERRSFKIVTLADGQDHEWESCFWNVDSLMLGPTDAELPDQSAFVPIKRQHRNTHLMKKAREDNMRYIRKWRSVEQAKLSPDTPDTSSTATASTAAAGATTVPTVASTTDTKGTTAAAATTPPTTLSAPNLYAISKRFEERTLGVRIPMGTHMWGDAERQQWINVLREGEPIHFNAYVVWNRYRISLTTDQGLVIVDLEETSTGENENADRPLDATAPGPDREWVQYLDYLKNMSRSSLVDMKTNESEDTRKNSLVDIATVNNTLVITMKYGHLVWSFYNNSRETVT